MAASALLAAGQKSVCIAREALKTGACYFCVGALLGVRQPSFYSLPSKDAHSGLASFLKDAAPSEPDTATLVEHTAEKTCPVCLGILQHHELQHDGTCAQKNAVNIPSGAAAAAAGPSADAHTTPAASLAKVIQEKQYDSRRFFIGVRIPTSVAIRQHALR